MVIGTILLFGIPLILCTVLPFGFLRGWAVYLVFAFVLFLAELALIVYATGMSQMAAGFGSSDSSPWDGNGPIIMCAVFGASMIFLGLLLRDTIVRKIIWGVSDS